MVDVDPMEMLINDARALLGLSLDEVRRVLGTAATIVSGDEYQGMEDVVSVENREVFPGTVYLKEGNVELVYIAFRGLSSFGEADLRTRFGDNPVRLRSRAGKRANLWVFAEQGVACSSRAGELDFLEVFIPCTQREYEERIYRDPGPFIR